MPWPSVPTNEFMGVWIPLTANARLGMMLVALLWITVSASGVHAQEQAPALPAPGFNRPAPPSAEQGESQAPVARQMPVAPRIVDRGEPVRATRILVSCPHCGARYYVVVAAPASAPYRPRATYPAPPPRYPDMPTQVPARSAPRPALDDAELQPATQPLPAPPAAPDRVPAAFPGR